MDVAPLTDFFDIDSEISTSNMMEILSTFKCSRDADVQNFLRKKAIKFEKDGIARTYLCYDETEICGYFSLAIKTFNIASKVSKTKKAKLSGGDKYATSIPAYLLGQLGKDDSCSVADFGKIVMERIFQIIYFAKELVGGVFVYLDCKKDMSCEALKLFYERFGFHYLQESAEYIQMIQYI